jgi:alpha-D-ribose 1-methylphosphonate 5-triphosphate synthase subunit PhnI
LRGIFNPVQHDFAVKSAEQRFEQERILLKKERESERRLAELQIQALQDQLIAAIS